MSLIVLTYFACKPGKEQVIKSVVETPSDDDRLSLDTMQVDFSEYMNVLGMAETAKVIGMPTRGANGKVEWDDYYQKFLTAHPKADFNVDGWLSSDEFTRYNAIVQQAKVLSEFEDKIRLTRDISYGDSGKGIALRLDLYQPSDAMAVPPLIVWIHGGGWRTGSKENCLLGWLAGEGYAVAALNFTSTLDSPFPQNVKDIQQALSWLTYNAEQYGFSAEEFVLAGHSSGGHLATLVGAMDNIETYAKARGIIALSGAHYIKKWAEGPGLLEVVLGVNADEVGIEKLADECSPHKYLDAGDPPMLLMHSEEDEVVPAFHSIDFAKAIKAKGGEVELILKPGRGHGFRFVTEEERAPVLSFLEKHLSL